MPVGIPKNGIRLRTAQYGCVCIVCTQPFLSMRTDAKYCSEVCKLVIKGRAYRQKHPQETRCCLYCETAFVQVRSDQKYCSQKCAMSHWHRTMTKEGRCHWCGQPSTPGYKNACAQHVEKSRAQSTKERLKRQAIGDELGLCSSCGKRRRWKNRKWCSWCLFRQSMSAQRRRAKKRKQWLQTIKRRNLLGLRETAALLKVHPVQVWDFVLEERLAKPIKEWARSFFSDEDVYALMRARIRALAEKTLRICGRCGHKWLSTATKLPIRCPRPKCHSVAIRQSTLPWNAYLPDWRVLRPTHRGRKPAGKYILCATCGKEKWMRPSFLTLSTSAQRWCSLACHGYNLRGVPLGPRIYGLLENADPKDEGVVLLATINDAVPRELPEYVRSDVCQALAVKVLLGEVAVADIGKQLPIVLKEVFHEGNPDYGVSLDRTFGEDTDRTLHDLLPGRYGIEDMLCWGCEASSDLFSDGLCKPCFTLVMNRAETQRATVEYQEHNPKKPFGHHVVDAKTLEMLAQEEREPHEGSKGHHKKR